MKKRLALTIFLTVCGASDLISQVQGTPRAPSLCFTPKADRTKFRGIMDAKDWKNPYFVVVRDGARLIGGPESSTPIESVPNLLRSLPCSAWPYGRIVAVQEAGVRGGGAGEDGSITKNRIKLKKLLEKHGIEIDLWPSA